MKLPGRSACKGVHERLLGNCLDRLGMANRSNRGDRLVRLSSRSQPARTPPPCRCGRPLPCRRLPRLRRPDPRAPRPGCGPSRRVGWRLPIRHRVAMTFTRHDRAALDNARIAPTSQFVVVHEQHQPPDPSPRQGGEVLVEVSLVGAPRVTGRHSPLAGKDGQPQSPGQPMRHQAARVRASRWAARRRSRRGRRFRPPRIVPSVQVRARTEVTSGLQRLRAERAVGSAGRHEASGPPHEIARACWTDPDPQQVGPGEVVVRTPAETHLLSDWLCLDHDLVRLPIPGKRDGTRPGTPRSPAALTARRLAPLPPQAVHAPSADLDGVQ